MWSSRNQEYEEFITLENNIIMLWIWSIKFALYIALYLYISQ
jgi:hypothetical protein